MSTENGQIDVEIIPDYENEMLGDQAPEKKSGGCGCQKNKAQKFSDGTRKSENEVQPVNWQKIGLIALGCGVAYLIWKNSGKVAIPKVEVPKV